MNDIYFIVGGFQKTKDPWSEQHKQMKHLKVLRSIKISKKKRMQDFERNENN